MATKRKGFEWPSSAGAAERDPLAAELARAFPAAHPETVAAPPAPDVLAADALARRCDDVLSLAVPMLDDLARELASSPRALAFVEASGWMLWIAGDPETVERLAAVGFRPGTRWLAGTPAGEAAWERPPLELVVTSASAAPPRAWHCSGAPIAGPGASEPIGTVHLVARADVQGLVAVGAIAQAVEERLRSARAVREQVTEFAFRTAGPAEALLSVDALGRLATASSAARRLLSLPSGDLPPAVRAALRAALEGATRTGAPEVEIGWPGRRALRLLATPVRFEQRVVGGIVRVIAPAAAPAPAPAAGRPVARYGFEQILGGSAALRAALDLARTASRNDLPVVLRGESGTGKELVAQAIHCASARAGGPFVAVNCGSIPATLLEAELFGYEPGTFTGGRREGNAGKFEKASRGTIFLDEVNELTPQAQSALLRVLQEREVVRLGGSSPRRIDTRVLAATNASLEEAVRAGTFRADLFFRLNVLPILLPPLRARRDDVAPLARAFLGEAEAEVGRAGLSFSEAAIAALEAYPWPGNVRELRNVVLRSAATAEGPVIGERELPAEVLAPAAADPGRARADDAAPDRAALLDALDACGWNVARTAQALNVSRMTLYRWLHKFQIQR